MTQPEIEIMKREPTKIDYACDWCGSGFLPYTLVARMHVGYEPIELHIECANAFALRIIALLMTQSDYIAAQGVAARTDDVAPRISEDAVLRAARVLAEQDGWLWDNARCPQTTFVERARRALAAAFK